MKNANLYISLLLPLTISGCSGNNSVISGKESNDSSCLDSETLDYLVDLKETYYKQRFVESNTNIYDPKYATDFGIPEGQTSGGGTVDSIPNPYINSIDDLTLFYYYPYSGNPDVWVISFLYHGFGRPGGTMPILSLAIYFYEGSARYRVQFYGCLNCPEVFYNGSFYYIHEAFNLGIISINETSFSCSDYEGESYLSHEDVICYYYGVRGYEINV